MQLVALQVIKGWVETPNKKFENIDIDTVYINPASIVSIAENDDVIGTEYDITNIYLSAPRYISPTAAEMEADDTIDLTYRYLAIDPITEIIEKVNNALSK